MFSICSSAAIFTAVFLLTLALDGTVRGGWSAASFRSEVALLGSAQADSDGTFGRAGLQRGASNILFLISSYCSLGHVETIADR